MKSLIFISSVPKKNLIFSFLLALIFNLFYINNSFAFAVKALQTDHIVGYTNEGTPIYLTLPGVAIHEEITMKALNKSAFQFQEVTQSDGSPAHFSEQAIYILQLNDLVADRDQDSVEVHFDAESFNEGNKRLFDLRQKVVKEAKEGKYLQARITLGGALHTVQDFYAHTTWVELHPNSSDLAKLGESNVFESSFGLPNASQKTCNHQGLLQPFFLTSGFFTKSQLSGNLNYDNEKGKCIHGSSIFGNLENDSSFLGAGINKDKPNRQNFGVARGFAIRATRQYVNNILQDLKDKPEDVCGLMDQKCGGKPISSACTFSNLRVDSSKSSIQIDTNNCSHPFIYITNITQTSTCNPKVVDPNAYHSEGTFLIEPNVREYEIAPGIPLGIFAPAACLSVYRFEFPGGYDLDSNGVKHSVSFSGVLTVSYDLR